MKWNILPLLLCLVAWRARASADECGRDRDRPYLKIAKWRYTG